MKNVLVKTSIGNMESSVDEERISALDCFKSMMPCSLKSMESLTLKSRKQPKRRVKVFTSKALVKNWLSIHRETLFKNPKSAFYGCEQQFKTIAEYWLKRNGHHTPCNDSNIIQGQKLWDDYIKMFVLLDD